MLLDYSKAEQKQLDNINVQLKASLDKAYEELNKAEAEFEKLDKNAQQGKRQLNEDEARITTELEKAQKEYNTLLMEYEEKRSAITHKAEKRTAKHFTKNTEELTEKLQHEIEAQIVSFGILQNHAEFQEIFQNGDKLKEYLTEALGQYLEILKKHDGKRYQLVIDFIDSSVAEREEIMRAYRAMLGETPTESAKATSMWSKPYLFLHQNNATNDFHKVARLNSTRGSLSLWNEQATYQQENLTILIPHYDTLLQNRSISKNSEISTPTKKVLDIATMVFEHNGHNPSIRFSLDEYIELCGLSDKKRAREQVNTALKVLFDISISYDDSKNKNRSRNYRDMRMVDDKGIKNGIVYLHFAHAYSEMLAQCSESSPMPYPLGILQASKGTQHRNSFYIARKMVEHRFMNAGNTNERRISVRVLLKAAPFLATEEEVRNSDRRLADRITKPFMADLEEACVALGIGSEGYELHYARGEKIPDNELTELDYETFTSAYVWFDELPEYPNQDKRRETKAKIAEAALTAPKKKRRTKKKE